MRFCVLVVFLSTFSVAKLFAADDPPNIILILTDDHGWSQNSEVMDYRIPESKSTYTETPNIAKLMRDGLRFTSGYSPAPLCTPTRRAILCGTSCARSGGEFKSSWIPSKHTTIPKALKKANPKYRCAHFGKWGEQMISTPEECGYDTSDGMTGNNTGGMPSSLGVKSRKHDDGPPHFIDNEDPKRTETVSRNAIQFIKKQAEEKHPFYVQLSYYAVHLSVVARHSTIEKYKKKGVPDRDYSVGWAAMLDDLDRGIGKVLEALEEAGVADNTYVFLTADNGGRGSIPHEKGGRRATNYPLTGAKHSLYEGGVRVPFVVRGPGIIQGGYCDTPVVGYDFLPTFYDLAGGNPEELSKEVDGVSFVPMWNSGKKGLERHSGAIFFHRPRRLMSAVRTDEYKLFIHWNLDGSVKQRELFRLVENPSEAGHNIIESESEIAKNLETLLMSHLKAVDAEMLPIKGLKKKRLRKKRN